jgi:hypothetical protein
VISDIVSKDPRINRDNANLDFRLEKEFRFQKGKFGVFADIFNLLGSRYVYRNITASGTWRPTDINTDQGTFQVGSTYGNVTSITGVRIYKFSIRYAF